MTNIEFVSTHNGGRNIEIEEGNIAKAVINHVWSLPDRYSRDCMFVELKKCKSERFLNGVNQEHDWKDRIKYNGYDYDVFYVNGSTEYLRERIKEEGVDLQLVMSIRACPKYKANTCLVIIDPKPGYSTNYVDRATEL